MKTLIHNKIESYRLGDDKRPLIVDVSTLDELQEIYQNYATLPRISVFDLTNKNAELPQLSDIYEFMGTCSEKVMLITGFGSYFKLLGINEMMRNIHSILKSSYSCKFIIVTYQCSKFYNDKTPTIKDKIIKSSSSDNSTPPSSLVIVPSEFNNMIKAEKGLKNALAKLEQLDGKTIYVTTSYTLDNFKDSVLRIEECKTPFDILCLKDKFAKKLFPCFGTNEQWSTLLAKIENHTIEEFIKQTINCDNIIGSIKDWNDLSGFNRWLLFIYLKLKNIKTNNFSIDSSINKSQNTNEFIENIYFSILDIDFKEKDFIKKYEDRKRIIKEINDERVIFQFCQFVQYKNEHAIHYLTDVTDIEKKLIITLIDRYKNLYSKSKLLNILQIIYADLYWYLSDYNLVNDSFTSYFNDYKYLKVTNNLTWNFKNIVDNEAVERSFKRILKRRTEVLSDINFANSVVYFVDALGVEFLSYIEKVCSDKGLACNIHICRSNLPSTTENNTEFRAYFQEKNIPVYDEKGLDDLKHHGKDDYDFDKNKLPLHIIEEFNVLNKCLDNISKKIKSQVIKKAVIVSDHGATRLALLNSDMIREDVSSDGEHGGRICKEIPDMKRIPNAIIENGYCILADYNVFKGGRIGKVEMHGGATLEEVTIPIIEIFERNISISIRVISKILKASYKTNPILTFFSSSRLENVSIRINNKKYNAHSSDGFNFNVEINDIKKSGEYIFEVWSGDDLVSIDNRFKIESESAATNDLWG